MKTIFFLQMINHFHVVSLLSPPVHIAWWAHMHHFESVCHWIIIPYLRKYYSYEFMLANWHGTRYLKVTWVKIKWVKPSLKVMILAGGLTPTSSCIFSSATDNVVSEYYWFIYEIMPYFEKKKSQKVRNKE